MSNIEKWKKAKANREAAHKWNDLPNGAKYTNSTFSISEDHSKAPVLVRCGQKYVGSHNYWESPPALNMAILKWIGKNWHKIAEEVLLLMKTEEDKALMECQTYISEMQAAIDTAKETE